jgi:hypothetical protein
MIAAAAPPPFSQGPVWVVTGITVKDGRFDDYAKFLADVWKPKEEALEKAGYIIGYKVLATVAARTGEPDLLLCEEYKNMAAFDVPVAKMYAFAAKQFGSIAKANKNEIARGSIRIVRGSQMYRELVLK